MVLESIDFLRAFQIAIVVLGIIMVYFATKGYRKTKSRSLLYLGLGFLIVTVGAVGAGILFEVLSFDLVTVEAIQAATLVVGFLLILYSIVGKRD
ncbi:MAG TPA: hypothetical protein VFF30_09920 [Nitrososphaerales archaeon]|nr:hypothetical protein [Nitrososphaerales archaeon]